MEKTTNITVDTAIKEEMVKNFIEKFHENWSISDEHKGSLWEALNYKDYEDFSEKLYHMLYKKDFFENLDVATYTLKNPVIIRDYIPCYHCGEQIVYEVGNGYVKSINGCKMTGDYSFDIEVPSGKLLFCDYPSVGNDTLQALEEEFEGGFIDINYEYGRYLMSKGYASLNIAHFYVGNSSPNVLKNGNEIYVEYCNYDEEADEKIIAKDLTDCGYICTDLWWCTAFDKEVYKKLIGKDADEFESTVSEYVSVDVEPGTYRFSYNSKNNGGWEPCRFLTIKKI